MEIKNFFILKVGEFKYRFYLLALPLIIYMIMFLTILILKNYNIIQDLPFPVLVAFLIDALWIVIGMGMIVYSDTLIHKELKKIVENYKEDDKN